MIFKPRTKYFKNINSTFRSVKSVHRLLLIQRREVVSSGSLSKNFLTVGRLQFHIEQSTLFSGIKLMCIYIKTVMFVAILKVVIINCRDFSIMKGFSKENRDLFFAA